MLKVQDLRVSYGAIAAVKGVSFEVNPGEFVMILGRNGAGKTSLLQAIMGQVPAEGKIFFQGKNVSSSPPWKRVAYGLALVPEGRKIFGSLTVRENLELGGFVTPGGIKDRLFRVLQLFPQLKDRLEIPAGALSGGEQQMLAIARGLMSDPRVLLLDEPSMGLAPKVVNLIYQTLSQLKGKTTFLVVEQNLSRGLSLADRIFFLDGGRLVKELSSGEFSSKEIETLYLGGKP